MNHHRESDENRGSRAVLLYDGARSFILSHALEDRRLELSGLVSFLSQMLARDQQEDFETHLFTSFDVKNSAQKTFIDTFSSVFANVKEPHTCKPSEVDAYNPTIWVDSKIVRYRHISFSSTISFFLGAYWASKQFSRVMVFSDSYDLKDPMLACADAGIKVALVWFDRFLDPRYKPIIRDRRDDRNFDFWDLDLVPGALGSSSPSGSMSRGKLNPLA